MDKYVYFLYGGEYEKYFLNAVKLLDNTFIFEPIKNKAINSLQILHNSRPLNERRELPFKGYWFKRALKGMELNQDDSVYFLLYESFHLSYSRKFLIYLKEKFPNCRTCFMYLNPVTELIAGKLDKLKGVLDTVITFNQKDADRYNLIYCASQPMKLPICIDKSITDSDIFFIGSDKGRLDRIIEIYERLSALGYKCDFHVVDVDENKQKYKDDIIYNRRMTYEQVLAHVYATKCVLELLQNDEDYVSIRTYEAIQYHRKLLTQSASVKNMPFYDPRIIQVFNKCMDIDPNFITLNIDDDIYIEKQCGDGDNFHRFLSDNI